MSGVERRSGLHTLTSMLRTAGRAGSYQLLHSQLIVLQPLFSQACLPSSQQTVCVILTRHTGSPPSPSQTHGKPTLQARPAPKYPMAGGGGLTRGWPPVWLTWLWGIYDSDFSGYKLDPWLDRPT